MLGEQINTEGPIHIDYSEQFVPHASNGKDQPEMAMKQFHLNCCFESVSSKPNGLWGRQTAPLYKVILHNILKCCFIFLVAGQQAKWPVGHEDCAAVQGDVPR